jgi:catechol 2,3-dioxygenase-like lactoylglutathione lyase family enzyme
MLRGDGEAMRLLKEAGATEPEIDPRPGAAQEVHGLASSIRKSDPMFWVADMRATVRWYQSIGFTLVDKYEDGGELMFARLAFGKCELGLSPGASTGPKGVSLWLYTDRVKELYQLLKSRQLQAAQNALAGSADEPAIRFDEDLYTPFYGGSQFSIRDNNGLSLVFWQPEWLAPTGESPADR